MKEVGIDISVNLNRLTRGMRELAGFTLVLVEEPLEENVHSS